MQAGLPFSRQLVYACGMTGWSIMINLISVILVYIYLPPSGSGIPPLITQAAVFGIFNVIAIVTAGGRLADAIYDPLIAQFSDRSRNPQGRRIPLMKKAVIPSFVFCFLVFVPLRYSESNLNIAWLVFTLVGFYMSSTTYIIPYNALLPELAHSAAAKMRLATWQSIGYVAGIAIASNAFNIAEHLQVNGLGGRIQSLQVTVCLLSALAAIFMAVTAYGIDERRYSVSRPSSVSLRRALRQTLGNRNFLLFVVADFSYFIALTIITSGLMYFITVLLQLPERIGNKLMITMVLLSLLFYPLVNLGADRLGKKKIMVGSLLLLAFIFLGVYELGHFPAEAETQIFCLVILSAIPMASLNILPNAVLADIIQKDSRESGGNKEAIYFAVRYFFVKIAQTIGIGMFSMFLLYGKDIGNDHGIRMNGILGFVLCFTAALVFSRFREEGSGPGSI